MRAQQKFTAAEQQIVSLSRILQRLREEDDTDKLIQTTISYLTEQFDYPLVWIAIYDKLNHILFGKGGITPGSDTNFLQQRLVLNPGDLLEQVVIEQRPLGVADLRDEKRAEEWHEIARKYDIQGTLIFPIRHQDRCFGVLLLGSKSWGYLIPNEAKARLMMVLGELGAVLYQCEVDLYHKQAKRIDEPLLKLVEKTRTLADLQQRLELVVSTTHQFISPNHTTIYWFEPKERYFWRRVSSNHFNLDQPTNSKQAKNGITVEDLSDFYYALSVNQIVWIGEERSSLKSYFTAKLLQRLSVRSILAAPIIWQKDLLGFLAVESKQPHIWTEIDKKFIKGAADLISILAPNEYMETTIQKIQEDAALTSQIAAGIYSDRDPELILKNCATKVLQRLSATRFALLSFDDRHQYKIFYESQAHNRRPLSFNLDALKEVDWQLLMHSTTGVGVENLDADLRFVTWRDSLLLAGVRSLVVSNCTPGNAPLALLLIATEGNRSWTTQEKELVRVIAQQLGVIVRQWQLHQETQRQHNIWQTLGQHLLDPGLAESGENQLERTALKQIAAVLNCPLTILLSWKQGEAGAKIIPGVIASNEFSIAIDAVIPLALESLIGWAIAHTGLLKITVDDLAPETRTWLHGAAIGEILIMALHTAPNYEPTGVIVIADCALRQWNPELISVAETLITQLAWSRRQHQITYNSQEKYQKLQQLNWYKYRRLENIQKTTAQLLNQMQDLGIPKSELVQMRYQQMLRQLNNTNASMSAIVQLEQWQMFASKETLPVASLLRRSLEQIDYLLKKQKLWVGVHGLAKPVPGDEFHSDDVQISRIKSTTNNYHLAISGDLVIIELVLHELLLAACDRAIDGGRIDIWCRRMDENILEISITDNGKIEPQLLTELHQNQSEDVLAPSKLNQPPGLHLLICQNLIPILGGKLNFYELPDSRIVSRLLLPVTS